METPRCIWKTEALLGEGPLWVAAENAVYWLDILQRRVHRLSLGSGQKKSWTFAAQITSLALRQKGGFVASVQKGFAFVDFAAETIEIFAHLEENLSGNRFNDGKVDGNGRFWAGSMDQAGSQATGSLYQLNANLKAQKVDAPYIISNGPAFSADGKTMYHTDSVKKTIFAFTLRADGSITEKRPFIQLTDPADGHPDGMTVDSENCLWLAHYGGARLTRFSPAGEVLQVVPLPVPNVTSCTFGGPALDTLYITTARSGLTAGELAQFPLSGSLFAWRPGVTGLPTPEFAG